MRNSFVGPHIKVSSGVDGLDQMLGGGLLPGRPYLIVGEPGSGKTTMALQFLLKGIRQGEEVLYVTLDEPPNELRFNFRGFPRELDKMWVFDAIPDVMRYEKHPFKDIATVREAQRLGTAPLGMRRTDEFRSVEIAFSALMQAIKMETVKRLYGRMVIDSLTALKFFGMKGFDDTQGAQVFLRFLSELRITTILTIEEAPVEPLLPERMLSRGEIHLYSWHSNRMVVRALGVEKFRGSYHDHYLHPYRITSHGIDIDTTMSISKDTRELTPTPRTMELLEAKPSESELALEAEWSLLTLMDDVKELVDLGIDVDPVRELLQSAHGNLSAMKLEDTFKILLEGRQMVNHLILTYQVSEEFKEKGGGLMALKRSMTGERKVTELAHANPQTRDLNAMLPFLSRLIGMLGTQKGKAVAENLSPQLLERVARSMIVGSPMTAEMRTQTGTPAPSPGNKEPLPSSSDGAEPRPKVGTQAVPKTIPPLKPAQTTARTVPAQGVVGPNVSSPKPETRPVTNISDPSRPQATTGVPPAPPQTVPRTAPAATPVTRTTSPSQGESVRPTTFPKPSQPAVSMAQGTPLPPKMQSASAIPPPMVPSSVSTVTPSPIPPRVTSPPAGERNVGPQGSDTARTATPQEVARSGIPQVPSPLPERRPPPPAPVTASTSAERSQDSNVATGQRPATASPASSIPSETRIPTNLKPGEVIPRRPLNIVEHTPSRQTQREVVPAKPTMVPVGTPTSVQKVADGREAPRTPATVQPKPLIPMERAPFVPGVPHQETPKASLGAESKAPLSETRPAAASHIPPHQAPVHGATTAHSAHTGTSQHTSPSGKVSEVSHHQATPAHAKSHEVHGEDLKHTKANTLKKEESTAVPHHPASMPQGAAPEETGSDTHALEHPAASAIPHEGTTPETKKASRKWKTPASPRTPRKRKKKEDVPEAPAVQHGLEGTHDDTPGTQSGDPSPDAGNAGVGSDEPKGNGSGAAAQVEDSASRPLESEHQSGGAV